MKKEIKSESAPASASARFCPLCGALHAVPQGQPSPWPNINRDQIESLPALLAERDRLKRCLGRTLAGLPGCVSHGEYYAQAIIADIRSTLEGGK